MSSNLDAPPRTDLTAPLERALIDEFLESRGLTAAMLNELPAEEAREILRAASAHASARLAEVESRAQYVHELHHND